MCPQQPVPCLTLSKYATQISSGNVSTSNNTTLVLQPGNHTLWVELSVQNVASFTSLSDGKQLTAAGWSAYTLYCVLQHYIWKIFVPNCCPCLNQLYISTLKDALKTFSLKLTSCMLKMYK